MFQTGFWTIARYRGVPIRLHWSLPLGALFFGRFAFVPGFWLGFVALVLVHELGHASLARARKLSVYDVQVHGLGGVCVHRRGTPFDDAIVAWGGVLAQFFVLYVPARVLLALVPVTSEFSAQLLSALLTTNLWLIGINHLSMAPRRGSSRSSGGSAANADAAGTARAHRENPPQARPRRPNRRRPLLRPSPAPRRSKTRPRSRAASRARRWTPHASADSPLRSSVQRARSE